MLEFIWSSIGETPIEAKYIRNEVFVKEQGFTEEFDSHDNRSYHIVGYYNGELCSTSRFYSDGDVFIIGRVAVLSKFRGMGIAREMLLEIEYKCINIGGSKLMLHSQKRAENLYIKSGFSPIGEVDYEGDCAHIWMQKLI